MDDEGSESQPPIEQSREEQNTEKSCVLVQHDNTTTQHNTIQGDIAAAEVRIVNNSNQHQ